VGEIQIGLEDMILGLDYLRSHRVWVSYRTASSGRTGRRGWVRFTAIRQH
jgi:hypothetical protein